MNSIDHLPVGHAEACKTNDHVRYGGYIETIKGEDPSLALNTNGVALYKYFHFLNDREQFLRKNNPTMIMIDGLTEEVCEALVELRQQDLTEDHENEDIVSEIGDILFYVTNLGSRMYFKDKIDNLVQNNSEIPLYANTSQLNSAKDRLIAGALRMVSVYLPIMPSIWQDRDGNEMTWRSNQERSRDATKSYLAVLESFAHENGTTLNAAMISNIEKLGLNRARPAGVLTRQVRSWESIFGRLKYLASELTDSNLITQLTRELDTALNEKQMTTLVSALAMLALGPLLYKGELTSTIDRNINAM